MTQINNDKKCCATCECWLGYRKPNRLDYVDVSSAMDKGQCSYRALSEHYERQANYYCSNYSKWDILD